MYQDKPFDPGLDALWQKTSPDRVAESLLPHYRAWLRREKIQARDRLDPAVRETLSLRIVKRVISCREFQRANTVLIYRAVRGEVHLTALETAPEAAGKRLVYPRCTGSREITAYLPQGPDAWKPGCFGIEEPIPERSVHIPPEELDLVLCPCTVFDALCGRMGMGGGFYDRYLPQCKNARAASVAFEVQKAPSVPMAEWDRPTDLVLTEQAIYYNPRRSGGT